MTQSTKRIMKDEIWLLLDSRAVGGIETHVLYLAQGLKKWGYSVRIIFYKDYGEHPLEQRLKKARVNYSKLDGNFSNLKNRIREDRPALIHTHGYKAGILGRVAGYMLETPVLSTYHSGDVGKGMMRLYSLLDSWTGFLAKERIAVSHEIAMRLPCASCHVNNFVPLPLSLPQTNNIDTKDKNRLTVGFVGRLSDEKAPDLFCDLAWRFSDINFEAFGDGPMRTYLKWRYGGRVKFHGHVQNMDDHWKDIDLLCIPSRYEGLPMVALEAMAHGIPVLATDVGDLPYLIHEGKNGWITPSEDVDAMAKKLNRWSGFTAKKHSYMSFAARDIIKEHYSPDVIIPEIIGIYQSALEDHRLLPQAHLHMKSNAQTQAQLH